MDYRSAFVAVVGRPSSGKSTLVNTICAHKVSIVSTVPQTTRNKVRGILTRAEGQLVFIDTPGFHHSEKKFNRYMREIVESALEDVELVLYVIDTGRPPGLEEQELSELLAPMADRLVVALNKVDLPAGHADEYRYALAESVSEDRVCSVSALTGTGVNELLDTLFAMAPVGEQMYPEEYYTDQPPEFRVAEIIREQAITRTREEVPHAVYVDVADMEVSDDGDELWVRAFLVVERESQKGILVGKGGAMIRSIRLSAEEGLTELFPYDIRLDLRVKVNPKWRRNDPLLRKLLE
jgi:GTP-binding protein Era